jgi:hypothetical protein
MTAVDGKPDVIGGNRRRPGLAINGHQPEAKAVPDARLHRLQAPRDQFERRMEYSIGTGV